MAIAILQNAGAGKPGQVKEFDATGNGPMYLKPDDGYSLDGAIIDVSVQPEEVSFKADEINTNGEHTFEAGDGEVFTKLTVNVNVPSADGDKSLIDGNVTAYTIPEGAEKIRDHCFFGCAELSYVKIPDSVTSIGAAAFWGCSSLTSITITDSVTSIGDYAFEDCSSIKTYDFTACTDVPNLGDAALKINEGTKIIVPYDLYDEWIKTDGWENYTDYIKALGAKSAPDTSKFSIFVPPDGKDSLKYILDFNLFGKKLTFGAGKSEALDDKGVPFLRIYGDGTSPEAYASIKNIENRRTGRYLVFAYRLPTSNPEDHAFFQIYTNTTGNSFTDNGDVVSLRTQKDGKWHVAVIDLAEAINSYENVRNGTCESQFIANADGTYTIQKLRIDWFNQVTATDSYVDVAYVGTCDSIDNARSADADYEGLAIMPDDFVQLLGSRAVKSTYNGMEYVTVTDTANGIGEKYIEFFNQEHLTLGTSRYVGVLYRNAPGRHGEVFISSSTLFTDKWAEHCHSDYDTTDGWHFVILTLPTSGGYKDSVCRCLRYDYFNNLTANAEYSIDIAFIKFFTDEDQAREYCNDYMEKYGLN